MGLPGDARLLAEDRHQSGPEQDVRHEPDRDEQKGTRIAPELPERLSRDRTDDGIVVAAGGLNDYIVVSAGGVVTIAVIEGRGDAADVAT